MHPAMTDWLRLSFRTALMLQQAQMVIAMRMLGMAGLWSVTPSENRRMVSEKLVAAQAAALAATTAALRGGSPAAQLSAALTPIAKKTRANRRRLARRAPIKRA